MWVSFSSATDAFVASIQSFLSDTTLWLIPLFFFVLLLSAGVGAVLSALMRSSSKGREKYVRENFDDDD